MRYSKSILSVGKKYGLLNVLSIIKKKDSSNSAIAKCKCDCGKTKYIRLAALKNSTTKSCGCLKYSPSKSGIAARTSSIRNNSLCNRPIAGTVYGALKVIDPNLWEPRKENPSKRLGACKVQCTKCGMLQVRLIKSLWRLRNQKSGQGCTFCIFKNKGNYNFSPGSRVGNQTIIQRNIPIVDKAGRKFLAVRVKCDCGNIRVKSPYKIGKQCRTCAVMKIGEKGRFVIKIKKLNPGKILLAKANNGPSLLARRKLFQWAIKNSKPTNPKNRPTIVMTVRELQYISPLSSDTPCIWPWDDFGNPLSDAELKKAVRKAKAEWKKTHATV